MTASARIARQLRALMDRHGCKNARAVEKLMRVHADNPPSYTTIHRILNAEAKTQPNPETLRLIAYSLGETMSRAFPEDDDEPAPRKATDAGVDVRLDVEALAERLRQPDVARSLARVLLAAVRSKAKP